MALMAPEKGSWGEFGSMFDAATAPEAPLPNGGYTDAPGLADAVLGQTSVDIQPQEGVVANPLQPEPISAPMAQTAAELPSVEEIGAVDAQLAAMGFPAPGEQTMGLIGELQTGNAEVVDEIMALLNANPKGKVSVANPLAPIVRDQRDDYVGRGGELKLPEFQAQEFEIPPRGMDESGDNYALRVQGLKQAHEAQEYMARQNHDANMEYVRDQLRNEVGDVQTLGEIGRMGLGEAQVVGAEQTGEAEVAQAQAVADATGQANANIAAAHQTFAETEQRIDEDRRMKLAAVENAQAVEQQTRAKIDAMPTYDTPSYVKSMSGGQKMWALVGSIAGGWNGSSSIPDMIERWATAHVDGLRQNATASHEAAQDGVTQARGVYQAAMEQLGDESATNSMMLKLQYEDAERFLQERIAETTVPKARAQLQESLVTIEAKRREQEAALQARVATTPERFVRTVDPLGRHNRARLEKQLDRAEERTFHLGDKAIEASLKGEKMSADAREKENDRAAKKNAVRPEGVAQFATKNAKLRTATELLENFVQDAQTGNIAGRGVGSYMATEEGRKVRENIKEAQRRQLRFESQGVIGEDEIEDRVESMMSGWGDNELISNAQRLIDANKTEMVAMERGLTEAERQHYYRNPNLPPLPPIGGALPSEGAKNDASALGGRVVE